MSRQIGAMAVLYYVTSHDWDGDAQPGNTAVDAAVDAVAELVAADSNYDAALAEKARVHAAWKLAHCVSTATDADFLPLHAADSRVQSALARRRAALAAVQGGAA